MNKDVLTRSLHGWLNKFDDTFDFNIESSEEFKILPAVFKITTGRKYVKGILTYDNSNSQKEVMLEYYIKENDDGRKWLYLKDGVTGYESICLDNKGLFDDNPTLKKFARDDVIEQTSKYGWMACAGTGCWNKLFITGEEMKKVFVREGLI